MSKIVYSTHHFIFAFRWDYLPMNKEIKNVYFYDRVNFKKFNDLLLKDKWKRENNVKYEDFNHFTYFYKFVRDSVYDSGENDIVRYYEYDLSKEKTKSYEIAYLNNFKNDEYKKLKTTEKETYIKTKTSTYKLDVKGVTLFLLNTGVGVVSFDLHNTFQSQKDPYDILKINELGRRIYPQFLNFNEKGNEIFNVQRVFLSKSIKVFDNKEDFTTYNSINNKTLDTSNPLPLPNFIIKLFNEKNLVEDEKSNINKDRIRIKLVTDDRMFFVSWYGNDVFSQLVGKKYKSNNWWYSYIFGDKENPSIANQEMKEEQILQHTYQRWSDYGTLYGMSRDTFVCISSSEEYMINEDLPNLKTHQSSIYYQIAVLCLVQRASVLKFSAEVANITNLAKKKENNDVETKIENLYAYYIEFLNKIYFREVTSQIQGIEIYQKFQEVMNIHNDVKDLDNEIQELNNFANLIHQRKENEEAKNHTSLATFFLPAMLISGILGMNVFNNNVETPFNWGTPIWAFWMPVIAIFIITLSYTNKNLIKSFFSKKNKI